jgi:hypothetical protein
VAELEEFALDALVPQVVPPQDRGRGDEAVSAQRRGQALDECGEQCAVGPVQAGLGVGSAEYGDLVA